MDLEQIKKRLEDEIAKQKELAAQRQAIVAQIQKSKDDADKIAVEIIRSQGAVATLKEMMKEA